MLEEHGVGRIEHYLGHRDNAGVDLDRAGAEVQFGQVTHPRGLAPARIADPIAHVQRSATPITAAEVDRALGMAPAAFNALGNICHGYPWIRNVSTLAQPPQTSPCR